MSSCLCFLCHSPVDYRTDEDIREKYKDVVGINLCVESHLCHICCHVLHKLWLFRSLCLKKSMEYPILFSERGTMNLQRNELQIYTICPESSCAQLPTNLDLKSYEDLETSDKIYNEIHDTNKEIIDYFELDDEKTIILETNVENRSDIYHLDSVFDDNVNNTSKFESDHSENSDNNHDCDRNSDDGHDFDQNSNNDHNFDQISIFEEVKDEDIYSNHQDHVELEIEKQIQEVPAEKTQSDKKRKKKNKKEGFIKTVLSVEEQKAELEAKRKEKKYLESEFKCYNCAMGFLFKDTYQTHMMRHEESNGEYLCSICSLRFASSSVLRAHLAVHRDRYTCAVCRAAVRGKSRKCHADSCHRGVTASASCHLCGRVFKDSNRLQQHLKRFHQWKNSRKTYRCNVCGEQCSNQAAVRAHMIKHVKKSFPCVHCRSTFSSPYTLAQHTRKHSTSVPIEDMFCCELCQVSFSTKKSLLAHNRNTVKHQQSCYWCTVCSRSFGTRLSLKRHTDSVHLLRAHASTRRPPPTVICHLCAGTFKGVSKLNRHLKEVCEKAKLEEQLSCYYEQEDG